MHNLANFPTRLIHKINGLLIWFDFSGFPNFGLKEYSLVMQS